MTCAACQARFPIVAGIPDLRLDGASWVDQEADRAEADRLAADPTLRTAHDVVRAIFAARPGWTSARVERRTREVLAAPQHLRAQLGTWLAPAVTQPGIVLDVGCGPGMFLAAAARQGRPLMGIDVSLVWLVVAKRLIEEHGGTAALAAALGEALPLADGTVGAAVSLDVIEHVASPVAYLREMNRVLRPGGTIALSTPNRFSLAAEPHVGVWGVGWLPRRWQRSYVRWRSGQPYDSVALLSARELRRLLDRETDCEYCLHAPAVPEPALADFSPRRRRLARFYNRAMSQPLGQWLGLRVGAFFRVVGAKRDSSTTSHRRS